VMGGLIAAAYALVWLVYGWRLSIHFIDHEIRRHMRNYPSLYPTVEKASAETDRGMSIFAGYAVAIIWPVSLPARGLYRLISENPLSSALFVTPIEKQDARDRELKALRRQAREMGLPMPDTEESRHDH
jgi:hypothetical protein